MVFSGADGGGARVGMGVDVGSSSSDERESEGNFADRGGGLGEALLGLAGEDVVETNERRSGRRE